MHELSICRGILEVAGTALVDHASSDARVTAVTVRVGRLTGIVPDTLRHYFALLTVGTPFADAALVIEEVPIRGQCADCGAAFEIDTLCFTCPVCRSGFVRLQSGRELQVVCLDTAEEVVRAG